MPAQRKWLILSLFAVAVASASYTAFLVLRSGSIDSSAGARAGVQGESGWPSPILEGLRPEMRALIEQLSRLAGLSIDGDSDDRLATLRIEGQVPVQVDISAKCARFMEVIRTLLSHHQATVTGSQRGGDCGGGLNYELAGIRGSIHLTMARTADGTLIIVDATEHRMGP